MSQLVIKPPPILSGATITLPLSKSIANRVLVIAYLAGKEDIVSFPECNDSLIMFNLLKQLRLESSSHNQEDGVEVQFFEYNAGDAGTVFRFLTALLSVTPGKRVLGGSTSLNSRPCGPLIKALSSLGAKISYLEKEEYPPVLITGSKLQGGVVDIDSSVSSQFISALMMIAPMLPNGLKIKLTGNLVSRPYIHLTAAIMKDCGVKTEFIGSEIIIPKGVYTIEHDIAEGDWSAASYWYALVAMCDSKYRDIQIILKGLNKDSSQGDKILQDIYKQLGVESTWVNGDLILTNTGKYTDYLTCNLKDYPDLTPALAVTCAGLQVNASLTGLETLAIKESNRLLSIQTELKKLGYNCNIESNHTLMILKGFTQTISHTINTYNDHRIAMAMSLLSIRTGNLVINDPMVVNKSYPSFWGDLQTLGFIIE